VSQFLKLFIFCVCLGTYWIQSKIDRKTTGVRSTKETLYLASGNVLKKLSLGHHGLLADIYWMRAVQYYGGKRLKNENTFELLQPLLEITTTLDPKLLHAYRFGSIFLSERGPIGANHPEQAITLLQKGISHNPEQWRLYRDLGFVYYWYLNDYKKAAEAFLEGGKNPNAAPWMKTFAAELLGKDGNRRTARFLWQEIYETSENRQLKENAKENLLRLTAEQEIETLQALVNKVETRIGRKIRSLDELVPLGFFQKVPLDPKGFSYILNPKTSKVSLSNESTIRRY
jgi:tetratricopeptide (TPR) repeat protein